MFLQVDLIVNGNGSIQVIYLLIPIWQNSLTCSWFLVMSFFLARPANDKADSPMFSENWKLSSQRAVMDGPGRDPASDSGGLWWTPRPVTMASQVNTLPASQPWSMPPTRRPAPSRRCIAGKSILHNGKHEQPKKRQRQFVAKQTISKGSVNLP